MFGRRACSVAGPAAWNSLPTRLPARSVTRSFDSFRRRDLKTFLFSFYQRTQRIRALRLCALYKSTVDTDVDNHVVAATAAAVAACGDAWRNAVGASSFRAPKARSLQEDCVGFRRRKSFQFTHLQFTSWRVTDARIKWCACIPYNKR